MKTMRPISLRNERGFTLTEMLVVCAILGIVMAGVLSILVVGQQSATATSNKVDAQANARIGIERMIEEIREAGYLPAGPTCPGAPATPCPPFTYGGFAAISSQTSTGFTIQNDWNASNSIQTTAVTDPITGGNRGEQIIYSFSGGQLLRREMGVDASPVALASGITSLSFTYLDQDNVVTATAADIRTVTITMTTQQSTGQPQVTMVHRVRLRNRPTS